MWFYVTPFVSTDRFTSLTDLLALLSLLEGQSYQLTNRRVCIIAKSPRYLSSPVLCYQGVRLPYSQLASGHIRQLPYTSQPTSQLCCLEQPRPRRNWREISKAISSSWDPDCTMKASPFLISWHNDNTPIYSAHFEPHGKGRLATGGGDNNVRLWRVQRDGEERTVTYLTTLIKVTS